MYYTLLRRRFVEQVQAFLGRVEEGGPVRPQGGGGGEEEKRFGQSEKRGGKALFCAEASINCQTNDLVSRRERGECNGQEREKE